MILVCGFVAFPLASQDLRQYKEYDRYRYLPRLPSPSSKPTPFPFQQKELEGDDRVILDELKSLIFLNDPEKLTARSIDATGIQVNSESGLVILKDPEFQEIAGAYLGKPVSMRLLNELVRDVILFYRGQDRPVVDVSIPSNQEITNGVIQILITEAKVGRVIVQGSQFFDDDVLLKQPFISPGDPVFESELSKDLQWLNRNPFRKVDLKLTPGENRGETDVVFNVEDDLPWRIYSGYEDTGTRSTGLERTFYGFNWFNAFNRDDQAGYQYTASSDFRKLGAHSAFYSRALQNRDIVTLYGSYAEFTSPIAFFGTSSGVTWQVLGRKYHELKSDGKYKQGFVSGFDVKQTNNNLDFGGALIFGEEVSIVQMMMGYQGRYEDAYGSWNLGADGYLSPGNIGGGNRSPTFQQVRPFSTANYFYARGFLERRQSLNRNLELVGRFTGQLSEANLIVTEQLGLGGYNSVRGFDLYTAVQDSGFILNLELHTKPISLVNSDDELKFLGFYDYGQGYNHTLLPGEASTVRLQGMGAGLRYQLQSNIELRADYGWQIDSSATLISYRSRSHIGCVLSY